MKEYRGTVDRPMHWRVDVVEDGMPQLLSWRLDVANHSPSGLSWGYGGSGPAQLALAILCDAVGEERAKPLYQDFKWTKIAGLKQGVGWTMSHADVLAWVEAAERERAR